MWNMVRDQFFKAKVTSDQIELLSKKIKKGLNSITSSCDVANIKTEDDLKILSEQIDKAAYRIRRNEFVSGTLQEFCDLDPSSLGIIYDYKAEDHTNLNHELR